MTYAQITLNRHLFRLLCAVLAVGARVLWAWYDGYDFMHPNKYTATFITWTTVIAVLTYIAVLPRSGRTP